MRPFRAPAFALIAAASAAMVGGSASCASNEPAPDAPPTTPDARVGEAFDGAHDAAEEGSPCRADGACAAVSCDQASWCPVDGAVPIRYVLTSVWGSGANDVWAVGSGGTIIHWDGVAWKTTPSGTTETLNAVWGSGQNDVYAISTRSRILHFTGFQGGMANWSLPVDAPAYEGLPHRMRTIWGFSPADVWVGGDFIFRYDYDLGVITTNFNRWRKVESDGGIAWDGETATGALAYTEIYQVQATVRCIWGSGANDVWVLADRGGYTGVWGPGAPEGKTFHFAGSADGGPVEWSEIESQTSSGLKSVWGSGPEDVWAVGSRGAIRHFGAGSRTWDIAPSPTTENLNAVWARAADDAWIVGDGGTILHFDGDAWTQSTLALPEGSKPDLYGIWGSGANDVWAVGDGVVLHHQGKKEGK